MKRSLSKNYFIQTGLVVILIIIAHYLSLLKPLENLLIFVSSPLHGLGFDWSNNIEKKINPLINKVNLATENEVLKNEVSDLEKQLADLKMFIEEQGLITAQRSYLESQKINFVNAQIIAKSYENNPFIYLVNRGEKDGIKTGMAVVNENGTVIGKITKTNHNQSFFMLIISTASRLSASLAGQSQTSGIVAGTHNISLELIYLLKNSAIKTKDLVVTSGQDNYIPPGLVIGEVGAIVDEKKNIFKSAEIISPADFKNIKTVAVILNRE